MNKKEDIMDAKEFLAYKRSFVKENLISLEEVELIIK